ncbi:thioredoxin domain-containing protein [Pseudorhodoplanes sp.]|uniref:thioredoxin domain-containing protein n=1 Tax=Pseudorhodoplanes sp. TaxID=1934341 RepID=UPI002C8CF552|nr:thioredoxin domain-containing protein [Pseudorhodoplanes sp.]HWV51422.1 thioredoxin domain-containing protein [Pseudorhodoplanes sp.]
MSVAASTHENRLARETSPYLLQHKHNPVEWWPWGPEALAEAKANNKPILLSVGYAACHWCHVMAHESFEDEATARVMNELFVNIKVDREERPDIDQIYMQALHHLGEQGGWPLTMFLTPAGEPVWGGTYFPPTSRYGRPAFVDVMREVARLFREEPAKIEQNRGALMARLSDVARNPQRVTIGQQELDHIGQQLGSAMDPVNGGLRGAPKFPQCAIFENLWRAGLRTGEGRYFHIVDLTLTRISEGGIYDHLGGGYSRYSVDDKWLVPHFEKMLYDNAQLLDLLSLAWQRTGKMLYRERAEETVGWLRREMTSGEGAFYSSLDADSEGEEGKFYVWSLAEVEAALGKNAALFAQHYDVTTGGNFEGHNILNRLKDLPRSMEIDAALPMLRSMLHQIRERRIRPGLDDKVLADWNGLMIAALTNAALAFWQPDWVAMARKAFDFVQRNMTRGDRLGHSWREGRLLYPGLASDFACMIRAALSLHEATGERGYLDQALTWQAALDCHYANPQTGTYFLTADDAEGLVVRPASTSDDATPNPNGVIAQNLIRLAAFTGDYSFRDKADRLIEGILAIGGQNLFMHVAMLNAIDMRLNLAEIVVTGEGEAADALVNAALALPYVNRAVVRAPSASALPASHPAQEKIRAASGPAAFICIGETCSLPVTSPDDILQRYDAARMAPAA